MKGLAVFLDALAILVAGGIGAIIHERMPAMMRKILLQVVGMVAILMGAFCAWDAFFVLDGETLEMSDSLVVVMSLAIGTGMGVLFELQSGLGWVGRRLERIMDPDDPKAKNARRRKSATVKEDGLLLDVQGGSPFADGFIVACVLCAVNSWAFTGAIANVTTGDSKLLYIKAGLDAALVLVLGMVYGVGVVFSALASLVVQGIVIIVGLIKPEAFTEALTDQFALVAAIIMIVAGVGLCVGKRMRAANMIPSLIIPPVWIVILNEVTKYLETAE